MDVRFTPQMLIEYYVSRRGISVEDIGVAPTVVLSWGQSVVQSLARAADAQSSPHWFHDERHPLLTGYVHGEKVSFVQAPIGAAGTVTLMEELIACGARVFFGLGWAGSLQPSAPIGTMLVPTACIREEGTSFHYLDGSAVVEPDVEMVDLLHRSAETEEMQVLSGLHWTTDAPYRELVSKIKAFAQQGVLSVDMETSAMYAVGQFRGVRVCNLLVVSDELWQDWRAAFHSPELRQATERAKRVVLRCLESNALSGG